MLKLILTGAFLVSLIVVVTSTATFEGGSSYQSLNSSSSSHSSSSSSSSATSDSSSSTTNNNAGAVTTPKCGNNEEYYNCTEAVCRIQDCSQKGETLFCIQQIPTHCTKGCLCKKNFLRNKNGDCVAEANCPVTCPKGMTIGCGNNCNRMCFNKFNGTSRFACPTYACTPGISSCQCDPSQDYWYDADKKKCVPGSECPKPNPTPPATTPKCGNNEEYYNCTEAVCRIQDCSQKGETLFCTQQIPTHCTKGCLCKKNFLRNKNGDCVAEANCPVTCPKGMTIGCGNNCNRMCFNKFNGTSRFACPTYACTPGISSCQCDPSQDYWYDPDKKKCVPGSECPKPNPTPPVTAPKCGNNEEYYNCTEAVCRIQDCSQKGETLICTQQIPTHCTKGCLCKKNFLRNKNGDCVAEANCPVTCPKGMTIGCGNNCNRMCFNKFNGTLRFACPTYACTPGISSCQCDPSQDYWYDPDKKKCVPGSECPKPNPTPPKKCGANEEHSTCSQAICRAQKCTEKGKPVACPFIAEGGCIPDCVCKIGYLRDNIGNCVSENQCPKCTGQNEYYDTCPKQTCIPETCDSIGKIYHCPLQNATTTVCKPACLCQAGYLRDDNGICILKKNCQPKQTCGPNQRYSTCIQGECRALNCTQRDQSIPCIKIRPEFCKKGCVCNEGYLLSSNGTCVLEKDCGPCPGNGVWNTCPAEACDADNCPQSRNDPPACRSTRECKKARCTCPFNHKRNRQTGECVLISDCPPFECNGPNETYEPCPASCPGEKCTDYLNNASCSKNVIGILVPCAPQCRCKVNYYRDARGICISACQCKTNGPGVSTNNSTTTTTTTTTPAPPTNNGNGDALQQQLQQGINDYGIKFLKEALKLSPTKNAVMSPLSSQIALGQLGGFSKQPSLGQILANLNLNSQNQIGAAFKTLLANLLGGNGVTLNLAVRMYANIIYPVSDAFSEFTNNYFNSSAVNLDFSNAAEAAGVINQWVADNTNNLIKNLIPTTAVTEQDRLILINAIYFKGAWKYAFNKNNTVDRDFHVSASETVKVPTMYLKERINYTSSSELNAEVFELPYKLESIKFVVVLPKEVSGLQQTLDKLTANSLQSALDSLRLTQCELYMPKFKTEAEVQLMQVYKSQNITYLFDHNNSGLQGILKNQSQSLYVSGAFHKAKIEVSEEGVEAAAATAIVVGVTSAVINPPPIPQIRCNRPFLYFIFANGKQVFSGRYLTPN